MLTKNLSSPSPKYIAVYGSLRPGQTNGAFMEDLKHLGTDKIDGSLFNLGWYPGVKLNGEDNDNFVVVDIFELPDEDSKERRTIMTKLDRYEGFDPNNTANSLFLRKVVTPYELGQECFVYEYNYNVPEDKLVVTGDWNNAV